MNKKLLSLYGLKWDPFAPEVPVEALLLTKKIERFVFRIEDLVMHGGFAMVTGEPGSGKSSCMRITSDRMGGLRDVVVGEVTRPQSSVIDFYRELGDLFGLPISSNNRWGAYKSVRQKWQDHIQKTLFRPVILIDEAQQMSSDLLGELRLLGSTNLDSCTIVTVVLAGDRRLVQRMQQDPDLLPVASRIRVRLDLDHATPQELLEVLRHALEAAGNPALLTEEAAQSLCEHATGNLRALMILGSELVALGAAKNAKRIDEGLLVELLNSEVGTKPRPKPVAAARAAHR